MRQILQSEADRAPDSDAYRHIPPHLASRQCQVKPSERGSFRSNASTPQPQSRPLLTSRPSLPRLNERGSFRPQSETKPSPPLHLSKLNYKERDFLRSDRAFVVVNRSSTAEINRWRENQRKRESSRRFQPKQVQGDLYIPSTVSVGQLAKLLNVRLRMVNLSSPYTVN